MSNELPVRATRDGAVTWRSEKAEENDRAKFDDGGACRAWGEVEQPTDSLRVVRCGRRFCRWSMKACTDTWQLRKLGGSL
ncbi:hypothetical protein M569_14369, partial [Genlisea aurea]